MNSKIYIHEFIDIIGHNRARYMHHMTANWGPIGRQERNMLCFGVWGTVGSTGRWPEVVNMWELDGWDALAANFADEFSAPTLQDDSLAKWWAIAAEMRRGGLDRIAHMRAAAAKRTLTELETQPRESWRILDHAVVLYQLFPNTVLIYGKDHCSVFATFPVSVEESVMHLSVLVDPKEKEAKPDAYWATTAGMLQTALGEDFAIGEGIQRNFHTSANQQQTFGKFEKALGWYHDEVDTALAAG